MLETLIPFLGSLLSPAICKYVTEEMPSKILEGIVGNRGDASAVFLGKQVYGSLIRRYRQGRLDENGDVEKALVDSLRETYTALSEQCKGKIVGSIQREWIDDVFKTLLDVDHCQWLIFEQFEVGPTDEKDAGTLSPERLAELAAMGAPDRGVQAMLEQDVMAAAEVQDALISRTRPDWFNSLVQKGWYEPGHQPDPITLGHIFALQFRHKIKYRPEVSRILVQDGLQSLREGTKGIEAELIEIRTALDQLLSSKGVQLALLDALDSTLGELPARMVALEDEFVRQGGQLKEIDSGLIALVSFQHNFRNESMGGLGRIEDSIERFGDRIAKLDERLAESLSHSSTLGTVARDRCSLTEPLPLSRMPIGRDSEIGQLKEYLGDDATRMIRVLGRPGSGKTTLVSYVLSHAIKEGKNSLPDNWKIDGLVYLRCSAYGDRVAARLLEKLDSLLTQLGISSVVTSAQASSFNEKIALFSKATTNLNILVFLDNLESIICVERQDELLDPDLGCLFKEILLGQCNIRIVYTSQVNPKILLDSNFEPIEAIAPGRQRALDLQTGLNAERGVELLKQQDPQGSLRLFDLPQLTLESVVCMVGGNPRALEVIGGLLHSGQISLSEIDALLSARTETVHFRELLSQLIGNYFQRLNNKEKQFLPALAVFGRPVAMGAIRFVLESCGSETNPNLDQTLQSLLRKRLIFWSVSKNELDQHDADRAFIITSLPTDAEGANQNSWTVKNLFQNAALYWHSQQVSEENWRTVTDLEAHFCEYEILLIQNNWVAAVGLVLAISDFLLRRGYYLRLKEMLEDLHKCQMPFHERGIISRLLADTNVRLGEYEIARSLAAVAASTADAEGVLEERRLDSIAARQIEAKCELELGRVANAIVILDSSLLELRSTHQEHRSMDPKLAEVMLRVLVDLAFANSVVGEVELAIELSKEAELLASSIKNIHWRIVVVAYQGLYYSYLGEMAKARETYLKAISLGRDQNERFPLALVYGLLSELDLITEQGNAVDFALRALEMEQDIRKNAVTGSWCHWLIALALARNSDRIANAKDHAEEALKFNRPLNNPNPRALLGIVCLRLGQRENGVKILEEVIRETDKLVRSCDRNWEVLYAKGWALLGLASCGYAALYEAIEVYELARLASPHLGHIARTRVQFEVIKPLLEAQLGAQGIEFESIFQVVNTN